VEGKHRPGGVHGSETVRKQMHVNVLALITMWEMIRQDGGRGDCFDQHPFVARATSVNHPDRIEAARIRCRLHC